MCKTKVKQKLNKPIMLKQINNIEEKKVSKENGEKRIGELLVDTYVKPILNKSQFWIK